MQAKYRIIDIHTHTYPEAISARAVKSLGDFYNFDVRGKGTYADLEAQAEAVGEYADAEVAGFLLFSVATNPRQVTKVNDSIAALAELSRSHGYTTVGFAGMHQDYPDFAAELERCRSIGLKGVKIHPDIQRMDIASPRMYELCELLEGNMPLFLHMGDSRAEYRYSEPKKLAALLDRFPHLTVVAAHLGGYQAWDEAAEYLHGRANLWYDLSSSLWAMTPEYALRMIKGCGIDRVMFGTDYPVMNLREYLTLFMKLGLDEDERRAILGENALRFFSEL